MSNKVGFPKPVHIDQQQGSRSKIALHGHATKWLCGQASGCQRLNKRRVHRPQANRDGFVMLEIFPCCTMVSIIAAQSQCFLIALCVAFADCDHALSPQPIGPVRLSNFGISRTRLILNNRHNF